MRRAFAACMLLVASSAALASPQGVWPEDARSLPMGRPSWVLVVPAVRGGDGRIQLWDRFSPWSREWVVPRPTPSGVRTVSISGDAEDQKLIRSEQLDNMSSETLRLLAGKYGAEAVAVVVEDAGSAVAVAVWKRGGHATWEAADMAGDPRKAALATIDDLFGGADAREAPVSSVSDGVPSASILAQRSLEGGLVEYRITANEEATRLIDASPSLRVSGRDGDTMDVVVVDGRDVEDVMREAGVSLPSP
jgi:hypothetical protein